MIFNQDNIARYCIPQQVVNGLPDYHAFLLRFKNNSSEEYLSANRIEYFEKDSIAAALEEIRSIIPLTLDTRGRFAVLKVQTIMETISREIEYATRIARMISDGSHGFHVGIFVPNNREDNKPAALLLEKKICANPECVYPGMIQKNDSDL